MAEDVQNTGESQETLEGIEDTGSEFTLDDIIVKAEETPEVGMDDVDAEVQDGAAESIAGVTEAPVTKLSPMGPTPEPGMITEAPPKVPDVVAPEIPDVVEPELGAAKDYKMSVKEASYEVLNGLGVGYYHPEEAFKISTDLYGKLDFNDPEFQAVYKRSSPHTKREMNNANNTSDALKIAHRNDIYEQAQEVLDGETIGSLISNGILPAVLQPTILLPMGIAYKGAVLSWKIAKSAASGSAWGATAGVLDETVFDANGLPTHYLSYAAIGALAGGGSSAIIAGLAGKEGKHIANALAVDDEGVLKALDVDPTVNTREVDGIIQLQDVKQMDKSIIDRIPFIGDKLRSDIHKALQSPNSIVRKFALRVSAGTVASRDAAGNLMPVAKTGMDKQRQLNGNMSRLNQDITETFGEAKVNGFVGSRQDYVKEVYRSYINEASRQRGAAVDYAEHKLKDVAPDSMPKKAYTELYEDAMDEFYAIKPHEFTIHADGAMAFKRYYDKMLTEGKALHLKGLGKSHTNRLYAPRIYNYKAIKSGKITREDALAEIKAGLSHDKRNNIKTVEELDDSAARIYRMLQEGEFNTHMTSSNFKMDADLPFDSRLQNRKWFLDESKMPNLLMDNFEDITGAYHYGMKGRISTQWAFGTDSVSEIMNKVRKETIEMGYTTNKGDLDALKAAIEDMQGVLRIAHMSDTTAWTWARNLATYNSVTKGGGFGIIASVELVGSIMMAGARAIMSGHLGTSLANSRKFLFQGGKGADEWSNFLLDSGFMSNALHSHKVNRYADGESGFNSGFIENTLNGMADGLQKWNMMRYFTATMEDFAGASIGRKIMEQNASATDIVSWGLTPLEFKALGSKLRDIKTGTTWDLHKLAPEDADMFQLAISRGIEQLAVQGDSIHAPRWFKTQGPIPKLLFQFMRFPLVAQETLMRRGMTEAKAQMVAGMFGSTMMYMGINALREEAAVAAGIKRDRDRVFNIFGDEEDFRQAFLKSISYTAQLGFMTSVYNYGAIATGNPELGRDWISKNGLSALVGPTGGMLEDFIQILRMGVEGNLDSERAFKKFKNNTPFLTVPLISEGTKMIAEKFGR